jgi:hypothetical protein
MSRTKIAISKLSPKQQYKNNYKNDKQGPSRESDPGPKVYETFSSAAIEEEETKTKKEEKLRSWVRVPFRALMMMMDKFHDWLLYQGKTKWTIKHDVYYAKRFRHILDSGDASELMTLSARNKHRAMNALANLAKFSGRYDVWLAIRQRYNLKWTNGMDSIQSFERFFDDELNYDTMSQRIRQMIQKTPHSYKQYCQVCMSDWAQTQRSERVCKAAK